LREKARFYGTGNAEKAESRRAEFDLAWADEKFARKTKISKNVVVRRFALLANSQKLEARS
jgi:hypothetical protein